MSDPADLFDEEALAWDRLRCDRNSLLFSIDKYQSVLLYNSLTDTQKNELATYRQALLDLPANHANAELAYANLPTPPSWMA
jgi:hypothetical protein